MLEAHVACQRMYRLKILVRAPAAHQACACLFLDMQPLELPCRLARFNCGELGQIARACPVAIGTNRIYFSCGGIGHLARVCLSRVDSSSANTNANLSSSLSSSHNLPAVSALSSAGKGAPKLFCEAFLDGMLIERALIDTGLTYSMIPM